MQQDPEISVIIPVLNDAIALARILKQLGPYQCQVIVVDGGSSDGSQEVALHYRRTLVESAAGRSIQMNAGAARATGDVLFFLHADSVLPEYFESLIKGAMRGQRFNWGRFDVRLSGSHVMFKVISWFMNTRAQLTGISTGDQGLFVKRSVFEQIGGFAEIPLMEDIEITKRLSRLGPAYRISSPIIASSRRWESFGITRTILLMWSLRLRYFFGETPESLAKRYYG